MQPSMWAGATIALPAGVIGLVAPRIGMGGKSTGNPYFKTCSKILQEGSARLKLALCASRKEVS